MSAVGIIMKWMMITIAVCTVGIVLAVAVYYYYYNVTSRKSRPVVVVPAKIVRVIRKRTRQRQTERDQAPLVIVREMNTVVDEFIRDHDWKLLLRLASVYEHGSYPVFKSNPEIARMMYMAIATMCPNGIIAMHAQGRVVLRLESQDDVGDELPLEPAHRAVAELRRVSEQIIADREYAFMHMEDDPVLMMVLSTIPIAFDDDQNVHDHGVVASLRQRASGIGVSKTAGGGAAQEEVMDAIVQREDIPEDIRADAVHFLSENVDDEHHAGVNTSTKKALDVVWQRIQNIEDPELKGNALDTLARQMADGYNHGHVVCPTGRIARILGSLDGVVDDVQPVKPSWAIKEEIASLAARYSEEARGPEVFEEKVLKTYVEDLGMSRDVVQPYVDMYKEHVQGP
jgi:hypothetical protein